MVADANAALYDDAGLARLRGRLKPGGRLAIWSAAEVEGFAERLSRAFERVEIVRVPVPRGEPDVVYLATRG